MMPMHHVTHLMVASVITSPTFWVLFSSVYSSPPQPPDSGKSNYSPEKREKISQQSNNLPLKLLLGLAHAIVRFLHYILLF